MMRFLMLILQTKGRGNKKDFLLKAAQIPGIYVPAFYDVTYQGDGTIASFTPNQPEVPSKVEKQLVLDMDRDYNFLESLWFLLLKPLRTV